MINVPYKSRSDRTDHSTVPAVRGIKLIFSHFGHKFTIYKQSKGDGSYRVRVQVSVKTSKPPRAIGHAALQLQRSHQNRQLQQESRQNAPRGSEQTAAWLE